MSDLQIRHYFISIRAVEISDNFAHFSFFTTFSRFPHSETTSIGLRIIFSTFLDLFLNFENFFFFFSGTFLALFGTFWLFLCKTALIFLSSSLSRHTNDKFGNFLKISKASPHYLGKKLVEITQIDRNDVIYRVFSLSFSPSFIAIYRFNANIKFFPL